jgi:hypothetical protein
MIKDLIRKYYMFFLPVGQSLPERITPGHNHLPDELDIGAFANTIGALYAP